MAEVARGSIEESRTGVEASKGAGGWIGDGGWEVGVGDGGGWEASCGALGG